MASSEVPPPVAGEGSPPTLPTSCPGARLPAGEHCPRHDGGVPQGRAVRCCPPASTHLSTLPAEPGGRCRRRSSARPSEWGSTSLRGWRGGAVGPRLQPGEGGGEGLPFVRAPFLSPAPAPHTRVHTHPPAGVLPGEAAGGSLCDGERSAPPGPAGRPSLRHL